MVGKRVAELSGEAQLIVNWGEVHTQTRWPSSSTLTRHRTKPSGKLISLLPAGRCTCTTRCRYHVRQRCVSGRYNHSVDGAITISVQRPRFPVPASGAGPVLILRRLLLIG